VEEQAYRLYIGTSNRDKVAELVPLLSPLGISVAVTGSAEEIEEPSADLNDGFTENATAKALAYAGISGGVTLAEDSGLSVAALGGLPGIWSARFADLDPATMVVSPSHLSREEMDRRNNLRVLEMMKGIEQPRRAAAFRIALVVAKGSAVLFTCTAERHGWIAEEARGEKGFGYDSIFVGSDTAGRTYAELDPIRKNLKSHRKEAMDQFFFWISRNLEVFSK
jgi:XTP/dITP diphosphohydrolase